MNIAAHFKRGLTVVMFGVLCLIAGQATAHDELLSYARVWAEPDAWVIEVNLDPYVTESFIEGKLSSPGNWFDHVNFEEARALLAEEAETFFKIEAVDQVLDPVEADFKMELDNCIYLICYRRTRDGRLRITH